MQMGIGDGVIPEILNQEIYDQVITVTDQEALETARELARKEGLMCGISSGTNVAGARKLARKLGPGKTVVTILRIRRNGISPPHCLTEHGRRGK